MKNPEALKNSIDLRERKILVLQDEIAILKLRLKEVEPKKTKKRK